MIKFHAADVADRPVPRSRIAKLLTIESTDRLDLFNARSLTSILIGYSSRFFPSDVYLPTYNLGESLSIGHVTRGISISFTLFLGQGMSVNASSLTFSSQRIILQLAIYFACVGSVKRY